MNLHVHTDQVHVVSTVAILAQGKHWIMRSRNPLFVFWCLFDSWCWNIYNFFIDEQNKGRCCQNLKFWF